MPRFQEGDLAVILDASSTMLEGFQNFDVVVVVDTLGIPEGGECPDSVYAVAMAGARSINGYVESQHLVHYDVWEEDYVESQDFQHPHIHGDFQGNKRDILTGLILLGGLSVRARRGSSNFHCERKGYRFLESLVNMVGKTSGENLVIKIETIDRSPGLGPMEHERSEPSNVTITTERARRILEEAGYGVTRESGNPAIVQEIDGDWRQVSGASEVARGNNPHEMFRSAVESDMQRASREWMEGQEQPQAEIQQSPPEQEFQLPEERRRLRVTPGAALSGREIFELLRSNISESPPEEDDHQDGHYDPTDGGRIEFRES